MPRRPCPGGKFSCRSWVQRYTPGAEQPVKAGRLHNDQLGSMEMAETGPGGGIIQRPEAIFLPPVSLGVDFGGITAEKEIPVGLLPTAAAAVGSLIVEPPEKWQGVIYPVPGDDNRRESSCAGNNSRRHHRTIKGQECPTGHNCLGPDGNGVKKGRGCFCGSGVFEVSQA